MSNKNNCPKEPTHDKVLSECNHSEDTSDSSKNIYRMIFDNANDGIIIHTFDGRILDVNQSMYRRLGYTKNEMMTMNLSQLVTSEFAGRIRERSEDLEKLGVAIFESADRRKDGTFMPVEVSARVVKYNGEKAIQSVVRDLQERKIAEDLISSVRMDKEILRREIINSMDLQQLIHDINLGALTEILHPKEWTLRLQSIRFRADTANYILKKLYQNLSYSRVEMGKPLQKLAVYLYSLHKYAGRNISISNQADGTYLSISKASNCVLIVSELISNAFQHAFNGKTGGRIQVNLKGNDETGFELQVRDNGIGIPNEFDFTRASTPGFRLIRELSSRLGADIRLTKEEGTCFTLQFN